MPKVQRWDDIEDAARDAYETHRTVMGRNKTPAWGELSATAQSAWCAAIRKTLANAYRIVAAHLITHIQEDCDKNCAELGTDA